MMARFAAAATGYTRNVKIFNNVITEGLSGGVGFYTEDDLTGVFADIKIPNNTIADNPGGGVHAISGGFEGLNVIRNNIFAGRGRVTCVATPASSSSTTTCSCPSPAPPRRAIPCSSSTAPARTCDSPPVRRR